MSFTANKIRLLCCINYEFSVGLRKCNFLVVAHIRYYLTNEQSYSSFISHESQKIVSAKRKRKDIKKANLQVCWIS